MKKYIILLALGTPLSFCAQNIAIQGPVENNFEKSIKQLEKHLELATLNNNDRIILINKLEGYFAPPEKTTQRLKNPQAELIYSTVIKSYNDILGSKSLRSKEHEEDAQKFAEQVLGKIIISTRKKNYAGQNNNLRYKKQLSPKQESSSQQLINKSSQAQTDVYKIFDNTIRTVRSILNRETSLDDDYKGLMINLGALTSPKPRMAGVRLTTKDAADLYSITKEAFYEIKNNPDLVPEEGFKIGVDLINQVKELIEAYKK